MGLIVKLCKEGNSFLKIEQSLIQGELRRHSLPIRSKRDQQGVKDDSNRGVGGLCDTYRMKREIGVLKR